MTNANTKKQPAPDQGNAIENETRDADSPEDESDEGVTEQESTLYEDYPDGGESGGKKF
jgi:hypothetical protein